MAETSIYPECPPSEQGDGWTVQRIGDIAICFTVEHFTGLRPVEKTGFVSTLKYGQVDLRTKPPVAFSSEPAISASMSGRDGFTISTNYDEVAGEVAFSLALMNLSATDVYVRIIAIGTVDDNAG